MAFKFLDKLTFSVVPFRSAVKALRVFKISYTPKRIWNGIKIISSMYLSKVIRRPVVWGLPPIIMVEPTNICNLKCPMCPAIVGKRVLHKGQLSLARFKELMDEIGDSVFQVQFWNQGEPFINKEFLDMVRYAKTKGVMAITSTNGHFIPTDEAAEAIVRSGLDQIIFSMDGTNQETYEKYRIGGNFNQVIEGLRRLSEARMRLQSKRPLIELQFIVFKHNQDEIDDIIRLAKEFKLDRLSFKTAMVYTPEQAETYLSEEQKEEVYRLEQDKVKRKQGVPNWCNRLWLNSTINWDGTVVPCCFDVDSDYIFDTLFERKLSFRQVWKNTAYQNFRRQVITNRSAVEMCNNCTEGMPQPYARIMELEDM